MASRSTSRARPTRQELDLHDTPALAILRERPREFAGIDPADLALCQHLLRVSKRTLGAFADRFASHGISPARYSVLMELAHAGADLMPSEIADRVGVSRATMTGLVDGLVRDGLVKRSRPNARDRRRRGVRLSAAGRALLDELMPSLFEQMVDVVRPLTERERKTLGRLLGKLERGLPATGPDSNATGDPR